MFKESKSSHDLKAQTIVEEEENQKKTQSSDLLGFTILDERWKDMSSDDSDDSLPVGNYISSPPGRFCRSVDFRPLQREKDTRMIPSTMPSTPTLKTPPKIPQPAGTNGGSRFKIVPVETRYKRSRWNCYDFYEHRDPFFTRVPKTSCPPSQAAALKKEEVINRSSRSLSDIHPHVVAPPTVVPQISTPKVVPPPIPKPVYVVPKTSKLPTINSHTITNGSPAQVAVQANMKNVGNSEVWNGLQTSLTTNSDLRRTKSYSVAASPPAHHALNIDSKIEQAMDLVKTHLMFAVREEVDTLRSKIFELENHVHRLESENTILKKTLPNDVLQKLHFKL